MTRAWECPDCSGEMFLHEGFLAHVESTDCAPSPWPNTETATQRDFPADLATAGGAT